MTSENRPNSEQPFHCTTFSDLQAQNSKFHSLTWVQFTASIINPTSYPQKRAMLLLSCSAYGKKRTKNNSLRHAANLTKCFGIEGDYDAGHVTIEQARDRLSEAGICAVLYTTPSHKQDSPRWRVIAPLSIPSTPGLRKKHVARLDACLGGVLAKESYTLSQAFYIGRVEGVEYTSYLTEGVCIDTLQQATATAADAQSPKLKIEARISAEVEPMTNQHKVEMSAWLQHPNIAAHCFGEGSHSTRWIPLLYACRHAELCGHDTIKSEFAELNAKHGTANKKKVWEKAWNASPAAHWRSIFKLPITPPECVGGVWTQGAPLATSAEGLPDNVTADDQEKKLPAFSRNKLGKIRTTHTNLQLALSRPDVCKHGLRFDEFSGVVQIGPRNKDWRPLCDTDYMALALALEAVGFDRVTIHAVRESAAYVARRNPVDVAKSWLNDQKWDGVPRIESFCTRYLKTKDSRYEKEVGNYLWTALAGRILQPGCKADAAVILVGAQGVGKSSVVQALAPVPEWFATVDLSQRDDDLSRMMRGRVVLELAELRGLSGRDAEATKAFMSRTTEVWIPKYVEHAQKYERRCVFIGTSNRSDFLSDETGNRRWLPIEVGECDLDALNKDMPQLWAEGAEMFKRQGVQFQSVQKLVASEHVKFLEQDPWADIVAEWLLSTDKQGFVSTATILGEGLNLPASQINKATPQRLARVMASLGHKAYRGRLGGSQVRGYKITSNV